jgi:ketosteroid isomerase-like protein
MTEPAEDSLAAAEAELQRAQLASDVVALEALLHPDVVYVAPDGAEFGRSQDLESHASGQLRLTSLEQIQGTARQFGPAGATRARLRIAGLAGGAPFEAEMIYTRTWLFHQGRWQVVQAHGASLPLES